MKKLLTAVFALSLAAAAHAACTESTQQCVIYKNGSIAAEGGCTVSKCPSANGTGQSWKLKNGKTITLDIGKDGKTTVNKKPGAQVKNSNAAGMGLTCYAADADKRTQYCATAY